MHGENWFAPLRVVAYVVLASMVIALAYSLWISLAHWSGIGV